MFNEAGIPSAHVDGTTPDGQMDQILNAYADGEILNLCCADLLVFGFDLEDRIKKKVTIESMSDIAPTYSEAKQPQKIGRVIRRKDFPAIINDHAGNWIRHGLPDDVIEWTLSGSSKRRAVGSAAALTRCPNCWCLFIPRAGCPECGQVRIVSDRKLVYREADLKEIKREEREAKKAQEEELKKQKRREKWQCRTLEELTEYGKKYGYKNPQFWAMKQMDFRRRKK
jgi:superfamily II DNA or RNA helicase